MKEIQTKEVSITICDICGKDSLSNLEVRAVCPAGKYTTMCECKYCGKDICPNCGTATQFSGAICNECKGKIAPYAEKIAHIEETASKEMLEIEEVAHKAVQMVEDAFDAFIKENPKEQK